MDYTAICKALPYREDQIAYLAGRMSEVGYDPAFPVVLWNGDILDGRHRYEAAMVAGVKPTYRTFEGTLEEALQFVEATNVEGIRHLTNAEKEYFYVQRAEILGVRDKTDNLKQNSDVSNDTSVPTQGDHAKALGVSRPTVARWEKDRKAIKADPELAEKAKTPEGYKSAKEEMKRRRAAAPLPKRQVVPMSDIVSGLISLAERFQNDGKGDVAAFVAEFRAQTYGYAEEEAREKPEKDTAARLVDDRLTAVSLFTEAISAAEELRNDYAYDHADQIRKSYVN